MCGWKGGLPLSLKVAAKVVHFFEICKKKEKKIVLYLRMSQKSSNFVAAFDI